MNSARSRILVAGSCLFSAFFGCEDNRGKVTYYPPDDRPVEVKMEGAPAPRLQADGTASGKEAADPKKAAPAAPGVAAPN